MVSKKIKIAKIFKTDKEIAEALIRETQRQANLSAKQRSAKCRRIAHFFRIHNWKQLRERDSYSSSKCLFCGEFQCRKENTDSATVKACAYLGIGALCGLAGLLNLIHGSELSYSGVLMGSGLFLLYWLVRMILEWEWKRTNS